MENSVKYFGEKLAFIKNIKAKSIIFYCTLIFVIYTGINLRIKLYTLDLSFWNDEAALAMNFTFNQSYLDYFKPLKYTQTAPPLFLIISKLLSDISGQINNVFTREAVFKIFPLVCGVISVPLFSYTVHKIFNHRFITLAATAILALNTYAINYSQEFKQYSTELLVTIILLLLAHNFDYKNFQTKKILIFSILFALAPWFSYSSIFILAAIFLYIAYDIIDKKQYDKKKLITFLLPLIISYSLFLVHYTKVSEINSAGMEYFWSRFSGFIPPIDLAKYLSKRLEFIMPSIAGNIALYILIGAVALFLRANKKIAIITVLPILLCILASIHHLYPFVPRLLLFLLPCFAIIIANYSRFIINTTLSTIIFCVIIIIPVINSLRAPIKNQDINVSYAKDLFRTMVNDNANLKDNVITYSIMGRFYLQPYHNKNINLDIQYELFDKERFINDLKKLPIDEALWLFAPYMAQSEDRYFNQHMKEYIFNNNQFEVLDYIEKRNYNYLLKFRKKY